MVRLALEPDERDPESSDENASPPLETGFGAAGFEDGVIGRDEWFDEPRVDNNEKPSYWGFLCGDAELSVCCAAIGLLNTGADEFQRSANESDIRAAGPVMVRGEFTLSGSRLNFNYIIK